MADIWNNAVTIEETVSATGSAGLNATINPKTAFQLVSVSLDNGTSPATSEDFTVAMIRAVAAASDTILYRKDMLSVDDVYKSWDDVRGVAGDTIDMDWANTNTVTYKYTVKYRRIA